MNSLAVKISLTRDESISLKNELSGSHGIHVLFGKNNSGKTRLLRAIQTSTLYASIETPEQAQLVFGDDLAKALVIDQFLPIRATWSRPTDPAQSRRPSPPYRLCKLI